MEFETTSLGSGVSLHLYRAPQFKTLSLLTAWRLDLDPQQVTSVAMIPSLLRRGTRSFPTAQVLARRCEELYGCRLSARVQKLGEQQLWWMALDLPHPRYMGDGDTLAGAVQVLQELLWDPVLEGGAFRRDYVEEEREVMRRALRARFNHKATWANLRCVEEMCAGERYALHPLGREEDLSALDPAGLYATYRRVLRSGQQDIFVVGDWEEAGVGLARDLAWPPAGSPGESLTRAPAVPEALQIKPARAQPREVVERQPVSQGKLAIGLRTTVTMAHTLYPALLFYDGLLGRYSHSKLFVNVREKEGLAYYANSILDAVKGILLIVAGIDPETYARTRDTALAQLEILRRGEISEQEWGATHRSLRSEISTWADDPGSLAWGMMQGLVCGYYFSPSALVRELDRVTRDQVVEVAEQVRPDTVYFLTGEEPR